MNPPSVPTVDASTLAKILMGAIAGAGSILGLIRGVHYMRSQWEIAEHKKIDARVKAVLEPMINDLKSTIEDGHAKLSAESNQRHGENRADIAENTRTTAAINARTAVVEQRVEDIFRIAERRFTPRGHE